jgi:DNA modification methylase
MARAIRNHGEKGDLVYDPFLGTGTTMVASENLGRECRGSEISPPYCAVILERMQTAFPDIEIKKS